MSLARRALTIGLATATGACTTYGVVENKPLLPGPSGPSVERAQVKILVRVHDRLGKGAQA